MVEKLDFKHGYVLGRLQEQGATLETMVVADLFRQSTVDRLMGTYRGRTYSNMWRVPDDIYHLALSELETWAAEVFPDPNQAMISQDIISLTAAYHWAN